MKKTPPMINQCLEGRVSKGCSVGVVVVVRAFTCGKFRCGGVFSRVFLFVKPDCVRKNRLEGGF